MKEDEDIDLNAEDLINQVMKEEKIKEEKIKSVNTSSSIIKVQTDNNIIEDNENNDNNNDKQIEKKNTKPKNNIIVNKRTDTEDSNSDTSSESSPHTSSDDEKMLEKSKESNKIRKIKVSNSSSIENLMLSRDINIKFCALASCAVCISTTALSIISSFLLGRLLTFGYSNSTNSDEKEKVIDEIKMNNVMVYILLIILFGFNLGLLIMISIDNDHMMTQLIFTDLRWYFIATQFAFGSMFLVTLIFETDLWTINVCLSICMLSILILAFYFTDIKQKKNMSRGTFVFIYMYI